MKLKLIPFVSLLVAAVFSGTTFAHAEKNSTALPAALKGVAIAEIPAQVADLIAAAKPAERETTAIQMVTATVKAYPTVASAIVGAVCTKCPDLAAAVTKAATSVQPKQAKLLAQAAAAAAPEQVKDILAALTALSETTPSLKTSLLPAVASLEALTGTTKTAASTQLASTTTEPAGTTRVRGPVISGPYIPLSGTPTNATPGTPVPPGGDYSRP